MGKHQHTTKNGQKQPPGRAFKNQNAYAQDDLLCVKNLEETRKILGIWPLSEHVLQIIIDE